MYYLKNKKTGKILKNMTEFKKDYFDSYKEILEEYIQVPIFEDSEMLYYYTEKVDNNLTVQMIQEIDKEYEVVPIEASDIS